MITDSFDERSKAIIEPFVNENAPDVDACIMTFSDKIEQAVLRNYNCTQIGEISSVTRPIPVYLLEHNGRRFAFFKTMIGAPACVGTIEDSLAVIRTKKYIVFGGAGCLDKEIAHGKVMVPMAAYRDEGTSYHYAPPSDYIEITNCDVVCAFMYENKAPYVLGITWTTDAFYRETENNFKKRKTDGCISVEMECAALQAMCDHRDLEFYTFFTSGDLLDAPEWDKRHEDGEISGTKHDAGHFDIALGLAEYVCKLEDLGASGIDRIITVDDWWDGPLVGLCTYNGEYCVYERIFSEEIDDWSNDYYITPVDEKAAHTILENYRRWYEFINSGGKAREWKNSVDISEEANKSPRCREFTRNMNIKGVSQHNVRTIKYFFVNWE